MSNTLGKAYYYMGRNYSLSNQIAEAAGCYIEADRLQIDDPICRGRVNSNMAYICAQNNNDSLALTFYERASYNLSTLSPGLKLLSHAYLNLHFMVLLASGFLPAPFYQVPVHSIASWHSSLSTCLPFKPSLQE